MKKIPLTQGKTAIVDDEDYERVMVYKWRALRKRPGSYYVATTDKKTRKLIKLHSLILGTSEGRVIDHKDHNGLNNQKSNLRFCTVRQNNQNRKRFSNNKIGFKGVSLSGRKALPFRAQIRIDGKSTFLGHYRTAREAAKAYDQTALAHFGECACLNFTEAA